MKKWKRETKVCLSRLSITDPGSSDVLVLCEIPVDCIMSVPRPRLSKTKHGGIRLSNITRIKTSSIPVINERDRDTSHLKIGLLNVRSLTSRQL